jgi:hypothetical protein
MDEATCVFCARQFVESQLGEEPSLYDSVFRPITGRRDPFFREVLAHARRLGNRAWKESVGDWNKLLDYFLHRKYGIEVFNEWLNVPYVQAFLVRGQPVLSCDTDGLLWDSAAHAMAFCNRAALLDALLSKLPEIKDKKVTCTTAPTFHSCSLVCRS